MDVRQETPVPEWPKILYGPDGHPARFDSPADVPRDYTPEKPAFVPRPPSAQIARPFHVDPALVEAVAVRVREMLKAEQAERMANARAARKSQPKD